MTHLYPLVDGEVPDCALLCKPAECITADHILHVTSPLYHSWKKWKWYSALWLYGSAQFGVHADSLQYTLSSLVRTEMTKAFSDGLKMDRP